MAEVKPLILGSSGLPTQIGATDTIPASALPVSVITPSQITSDQDNYNPTGFSSATIVRLSGDSTIRAITGFSAGSDGAEKLLINVGDNPIYFPGEHPDSTAGNRINVPHDIILFPKQAAKLVYDGTASRWMLFVNEMRGLLPKSIFYNASAGSTTNGDWGDFVIVATGSAAVSGVASSAAAVGLAAWQISTATTSASGGLAYFTKTALTFGAYTKNYAFARFVISIEDLSTSGERFWLNLLLTPSPNISTQHPNNSIGVRYSDDVNSGKFECISVDNSGSIATADSGITVAADTLYDVFISIDKALSEARFYINGAFVGRITSGLPSGTAFFGARAIHNKSVGTTARLMYIHSMAAAAINS